MWHCGTAASPEKNNKVTTENFSQILIVTVYRFLQVSSFGAFVGLVTFCGMETGSVANGTSFWWSLLCYMKPVQDGMTISPSLVIVH